MFEITWDFIEPHIIKNEGSVMNKGKNENFISPECNNLNILHMNFGSFNWNLEGFWCMINNSGPK